MAEVYNVADIKEIKRITWVGVFVNLVLAAMKFVVGTIGTSNVVIADAFHSLSDLSTDFAIILGVKFWTKPADDKHPYGHFRIELLVTAFINIILFSVGILIAYRALTSIGRHDLNTPLTVAIIGPSVSIVSKELLYRWTLKAGKKVISSAVIANAWHHRTDALSSVLAAVAVVLAINKRFVFVDYIGAFLVSLFILQAAWKMMKRVLFEVIDTGAPSDKLDNIKALIFETKEVKSIHCLRSRRMGSGWYIDFHLQIDGNTSVVDGHEIAKTVKNRILEKEEDVLDVLIHLEPYKEE